MEIDEELLHAVSIALTKGQGKYSEEEIAKAYEQVMGDRIAGELAELVRQRQLHLIIDADGVVKYGAPEGASPEQLMARLHLPDHQPPSSN